MSTESKRRPATSLRFATMKDLTAGGRASPAETLKRLGELLASSKIRGTFHLRVLQNGRAEDSSTFSLRLGSAKAKDGKAGAKTRVEVITTEDVWAEVASGRLAPHDAFLSGRMRIRGNAILAQRILNHVAASEGVTFLCREEE